MSPQALLAVIVALVLAVAGFTTRASPTPAPAGTSTARPPGLLQVPASGADPAAQPLGGPVNSLLPGSRPAAEPWNPGPGQLQGSDTSEWQSDAEFESAIKNTQFAVIKASQGTGFVDRTFKSRWAELGAKVQSGTMALRVAYCFLDRGNGTGQAKHFLDVVGISGPPPAGTRLALDWEAAALEDPATLEDAAKYVHQVTGLWPIIYVQGSKMAVAKSSVPDAPLWEASWGPSPDKGVPFVQYSDAPVYDHDVFNGDVSALKRFAGES